MQRALISPISKWPPDYDVTGKEDDCVGRALTLEEVGAGNGSRADCVAEASEGETRFVDIMGSMESETGGESEGFTFADNLKRADLLSETLLDGLVDTSAVILC